MLALSDRQTCWILLACGFLGLVLRVQIAAAWPLQNDEAVHLYRSWVLATDGTYQYTPWTHGPFLYYISALVLPKADWGFLAGRMITSLLWLPSLLGLYWLRDRIGTVTVAVSGVLLSFHHYVVWISTYFRNDIILLSILLFWLGLAALYFNTPTVGKALSLGAVGALSIAVKETSFLIAFVLVWTVVGWYLWQYGFSRTEARSYWQQYGMPAAWAIPVAGFSVLLIFFSGVPVTPEGILTAPLEAIRGPLFWLHPDAIIRARRGIWWYFSLLARSPVILIAGVVGGVLALRSRSLVMTGAFILFLSFFALHTFVTKQPRRFLLYMFVPLCLLAGYAITITIQRIEFRGQRTASIVTGVILVASAGAAAGGPAMVIGLDSPNTLYPDWGLDDGQEEALQTAATFAENTGCPIHVVDGSTNHQVSNWYLRGSNFTHGQWNTSVNFTTNQHVILSDQPLSANYPTESVQTGGFVVTKPQEDCWTS